MKKKTLSVITAMSMFLFASTSFAAGSEEETGHFQVSSNPIEIESKIQSLEEKLSSDTPNEKKEIIEQMIHSLRNTQSLVKENKVDDGISTRAINKSIWFATEGDEVFHSYESSNEPDHIASLSVKLADVTFSSGYDWSGESNSYWVAAEPYTAYKIKNQLTFTATGVGISGSLKGASFSGIASGSASVSNEESNDWASEQTFDANSSGSTVKAVFSSSSTIKVYSYSSQDSTMASITFYDPSF